jgi:pimeloyl-ACP methyl ester carboxylesterase
VGQDFRLHLVAIPTDDVPLDGLWYEPERPQGAVQLLHGNVSNFYSGVQRWLPPLLAAVGLACLVYNRRGHDVVANRAGREAVGGAFQTYDQAIRDNDEAAGWLADRGFSRPTVMGHSNGGMLAVRHVSAHPEVRCLVLLSAHAGGPNLVELASRQGLLARDRLQQVRDQAARMVADGRGEELMLLPGWWWVISAASFVDLDTNCPDTLALAPLIRCPSLFVRGAVEPPALYPAEEFRRLAAGPCEVRIVEGTDHWYNGRESEVGAIVTAWLERALDLETARRRDSASEQPSA